MAFFTNPVKLQELTGGIPVENNDERGVANSLMQADRLIDYVKDEGKTSEDDAKKIIVASVIAEGAKRNGTAQEIYASLPEVLKKKLVYTPEDLEKNQEVTVFGLKTSIALFTGSFIAAIVTAIIAFKYANLLPPLLRIPVQVAIPAIIAAFLTRIGWTISTMTNNWNDVFHWGPINVGQQLGALQKEAAKLTGDGEKKKIILRMADTKKPQLFTGIIASASLSSASAFERLVDTQITDEEDLKNDMRLNLNRWLKGLKGRLSWSVALTLNPFDEMGNKQSGYWAVMTLSTIKLNGARVFLDTILLGPVDPVKYMPTTQQIQTLEGELGKDFNIEEVQQILLPSGKIQLIDRSGNVIPLPFEAPAPAAAAADAAAAAAAAPAAAVAAAAASPYASYGNNKGPGERFSDWIARTGLNRATILASFAPGYNPDLDPNFTLNQFSIPAELFNKLFPAAAAGGFPRTVTVNIDALMVRSAPRSSAPLAGIQRLVRGNTFKAIGFEIGESVEGESRWWKSEFGNFVWAGGTAEKP